MYTSPYIVKIWRYLEPSTKKVEREQRIKRKSQKKEYNDYIQIPICPIEYVTDTEVPRLFIDPPMISGMPTQNHSTAIG